MEYSTTIEVPTYCYTTIKCMILMIIGKAVVSKLFCFVFLQIVHIHRVRTIKP